MKMGSNYLAILGVTTVTTVMSCSPAKKEYASFELYPVRTGSLTEMEYTPLATKFYLWSPTAEEVRLMLYDAGEGGHAYETVKMEPTEDGTWTTSVDENLLGKFYAFNVKINDKWQGDTPGINAHAVGVNGKRAAIIDWKTTNPEGWESDRRHGNFRGILQEDIHIAWRLLQSVHPARELHRHSGRLCCSPMYIRFQNYSREKCCG